MTISCRSLEDGRCDACLDSFFIASARAGRIVVERALGQVFFTSGAPPRSAASDGWMAWTHTSPMGHAATGARGVHPEDSRGKAGAVDHVAVALETWPGIVRR
jgi:hypothetical protein